MSTAGGDLDDEGWILLTEGMEPYQRFRYITLEILESALEESATYPVDERLFTDLEGASEDVVRDHLEGLDEALRDDEGISDLERAFLCATVGSLLEDRGGRARCYDGLLKLARCTDDAPLGPLDG